MFAVLLFDAVGARLENDWWEIGLREGTPPPRIQLEEELIDVNEADGVARIWVRLSDEQENNVSGTWDAIRRYPPTSAPTTEAQPWTWFTVEAGQDAASFEFELVDDDVEEGVEGFLIKGGWPDDYELGVPSVGYVRITDDDGGAREPARPTRVDRVRCCVALMMAMPPLFVGQALTPGPSGSQALSPSRRSPPPITRCGSSCPTVKPSIWTLPKSPRFSNDG